MRKVALLVVAITMSTMAQSASAAPRYPALTCEVPGAYLSLGNAPSQCYLDLHGQGTMSVNIDRIFATRWQHWGASVATGHGRFDPTGHGPGDVGMSGLPSATMTAYGLQTCVQLVPAVLRERFCTSNHSVYPHNMSFYTRLRVTWSPWEMEYCIGVAESCTRAVNAYPGGTRVFNVTPRDLY